MTQLNPTAIPPLPINGRHTARDFLRAAYAVAMTCSNDPRTQLGAVIVAEDGQIVCGANHTITAIAPETPPEKKYALMIHAERAAIHTAARYGVRTWGATMYCPWFACDECAKAIIDAGIQRVVGHAPIFQHGNKRWNETISLGNKYLDQAGVERIYIHDRLTEGTHLQVNFNGKVWTP